MTIRVGIHSTLTDDVLVTQDGSVDYGGLSGVLDIERPCFTNKIRAISVLELEKVFDCRLPNFFVCPRKVDTLRHVDRIVAWKHLRDPVQCENSRVNPFLLGFSGT